MTEKFEFANEYGAINGELSQELDGIIRPILDEIEKFGMDDAITPHEWVYLRAFLVKMYTSEPDTTSSFEYWYHASSVIRNQQHMNKCIAFAIALYRSYQEWLYHSVSIQRLAEISAVKHHELLVDDYVLSSLTAVCAQVQIRKAMSLRSEKLTLIK